MVFLSESIFIYLYIYFALHSVKRSKRKEKKIFGRILCETYQRNYIKLNLKNKTVTKSSLL